MTCEGCNEEFDNDSILKHIAKIPSCKKKYGDRFEIMKKEKRNATYKKYRKNAKRESWDEETKEMAEFAKELDIPESPFNWNHALKCEGCGENFLHDRFFKHVSHTESCKAIYGKRYDAMKKEKKAMVDKMSYKRNKEKSKEQMKSYAQNNAKKISERKSKKYYEVKMKNFVESKKSFFEKDFLIWKKCRLRDYEKFLKSAENEEMHLSLGKMRVKVEEFVQKHQANIENILNEAKELTEAEAHRKVIPKVIDAYSTKKIYVAEMQELDKEFEELAKKLNEKLSCYDCAMSDRSKCTTCQGPNWWKKWIRPRPIVHEDLAPNVEKSEQKERSEVAKDSSLLGNKTKPIIRKTKKVAFTRKDPKKNALEESDDDFLPSKRYNVEKSEQKKKLEVAENLSIPGIKTKPIIRKRKKVNFTMKDLKKDAEEESDDDFLPSKRFK